MFTYRKLGKHGSDVIAHPIMYRIIIGAMQYVTLMRPNIYFCVNKSCQFMYSPLESHWILVKRILRYLSGTITHGLLLSHAHQLHQILVRVYSDSDWRSDSDDQRSTSNSCIYFGPNLVAWSSKKQPLVVYKSWISHPCTHNFRIVVDWITFHITSYQLLHPYFV